MMAESQDGDTGKQDAAPGGDGDGDAVAAANATGSADVIQDIADDAKDTHGSSPITTAEGAFPGANSASNAAAAMVAMATVQSGAEQKDPPKDDVEAELPEPNAKRRKVDEVGDGVISSQAATTTSATLTANDAINNGDDNIQIGESADDGIITDAKESPDEETKDNAQKQLIEETKELSMPDVAREIPNGDTQIQSDEAVNEVNADDVTDVTDIKETSNGETPTQIKTEDKAESKADVEMTDANVNSNNDDDDPNTENVEMTDTKEVSKIDDPSPPSENDVSTTNDESKPTQPQHKVDTDAISDDITVSESPLHAKETEASNEPSTHKNGEQFVEDSNQDDDDNDNDDNAASPKSASQSTSDPSSAPKIDTKYPTYDQNRTKGKFRASRKVDPAVLAVRRELQMSCKSNDLANAMRVYHKAVEDGIKVEPSSFYSLLNLCDGVERTVHIGTPRAPVNKTKKADEQQPKHEQQEQQVEMKDGPPAVTEKAIEPVEFEERFKFAFVLKARMKELNLPLTEPCYTALIKLTSKANDIPQAMSLLDEAENLQQCKMKLRMYSSLLLTFCEMEAIIPALEIWKRILQKPNMMPTEREYIGLLKCATVTGNAAVVERVLTFVADAVPIPSKKFVKATMNWFGASHAKCIMPPSNSSSTTDPGTTTAAAAATGTAGVANGKNGQSDDDDAAQVEDLVKTISELHREKEGELPPSMGPVVISEVRHRRWRISSTCTIDTATGTLKDGCLQASKLKPCFISEAAWNKMRDLNATIVTEGNVEGHNSKFQGGKKGKKRNDLSPEQRKERWSSYMDFLSQNFSDGKTIDVVIDGANIGYFQTNFADSPNHVDYNQIDWVIRHFLQRGKTVLMFLHKRHFSHSLMPAEYAPVVEQWKRWGVLYETPPGMNDDWFWMHAAMQYRSLVLTNDEMRDHHFQMLTPRMFIRWKDRQQIHFEFGDWENIDGGAETAEAGTTATATATATATIAETTAADNGDTNMDFMMSRSTPPPYKTFRSIKLTYPDVYSRRVQRVDDGLVIPLTKRGDENRFLDGSHLAADDEPAHETYVCIRPCTSSDQDEEELSFLNKLE